MKSEQSLFNDVFFPLFKICKKADEERQDWENSKAYTFCITPYQFQASSMNFLKFYFAWINFRE